MLFQIYINRLEMTFKRCHLPPSPTVDERNVTDLVKLCRLCVSVTKRRSHFSEFKRT